MDLKFDFSFETKIEDSFRSKALIGQYDLENKNIIQKFYGDHKLPNKWNVGLIVGNSGTGKTSIAKNVFGETKNLIWDKNSIINNFDKNLKLEEITFALGSVGFNSVPYWLKPFSVLSNGEKSRVELARFCLENEITVYDEFSSFVDRDVAKSMSNSVGKLFRKLDKKLVAVTCHKDITEWINPDWVYDTDEKNFFIPKINEGKSSNSRQTESQEIDGIFIKNIII